MMREVPECLNRRYKAVDDLIQQLSWSVRSGSNSPVRYCNDNADPGIKLMCDFWNILKEDPECDLKKQVKERMGLTRSSTHTTFPQDIRCYQIADKDQPKWKECAHKIKSFCCQRASRSCEKPHCSHRKPVADSCCQAKSKQPPPNGTPIPKTPQSVECCPGPLNKALCNVNGAATFESQCNNKINDLVITQLKLVQQIEVLEMREKDGVQLLKKADCMWSCMEESYKKRLQESADRQNSLIKRVREIEASTLKWRKSRKEIESQISSTKKKTQGLDDEIAQKKADLNFLTMEIADFKKRIKNNTAEVANSKKRMETMKHNSELKVSNFSCEMCRLQKLLSTEHQSKINKEKSGNKFVKEARQELQKICRVLLRKRLENEDRRAEKAALLEEIDLLNITMDQCKNRCKLKQDTLKEDIAKLDKQIATYEAKCLHCNQCTDTNDVRRFCSDCPRCSEGRECLYEDGFCTQEKGKVCVCMTVKDRFLDNVFENMYTVLDRQSKNQLGKHVAESIMNCLKHSRNGKLNTETKKLLQDFILSTLRKNLNLTIVGGAVKTRCELDSETYDRLMHCLSKVTPEKEPKVKQDKSTEKKDPCKHWLGRVPECHCPYGPKDCACSKRAPPVPKPPTPDPPEKPPKRAAKPGEKLMCPHKVESAACGPDCGAFDALTKIDTKMSEWRPDPCSGPACSFKNVRAVQCVLGPEVLSRRVQARPYKPICTTDDLDKVIITSCSKSCLTDCKESNFPRERIIEEVMGRYLEVSPIQKVTSRTSGKESFRTSFESYDVSANNIRHIDEGSKSPKLNIIQAVEQNCDVRNTNNKRVKKCNDRLTAANYKKLEPKTAKFNLLVDSSQMIVLKDKSEIEMLKRERKSFICNRDIDCDVTHEQVLKITSDPEIAVNTETKETNFIVILDSKFYALKNKISASSISFTSIYSTFDSNISGEASVASCNDDVSSVGYLIRNIDVCNAAENLIKEVLVSESKANNYWGPEVEWMTISSFISTLDRRSINSCSNLSNDEVELTNITLEAKKSSYKEKSINKFNRLLNDTLLGKVKVNLIKSLNTYNNQGSQCTCNEITTPLDTANIVSENKDELQSSSISHPQFKKTEIHSKCCQYFLQSMMNLARNSLHKMNLFDPSMNCFRKFVKITFRKPVNWFMTSTSTTSSSSASAYMTSTSTTSSSSASEVV